MNTDLVRALLKAVRRAASQVKLYGADHEISRKSFAELAAAADRFVGGAERSALTLLDGTLYWDRVPLATLSLEFSSIAGHMDAVSVESVTFAPPVSHQEAGALAQLIAGTLEMPASGTTVLYNEGEWHRDELVESPTTRLRRAYSASLEALRVAGDSIRHGSELQLDRATTAVQSLLDRIVAQPSASMLLTTLKSYHEYTFFHSVNTSILALALARHAGLAEDAQIAIGTGALLHDIGKVGVPVSVLQSPARLTEEAWDQIRLHPQVGAEAILAASKPGQEAAAIVALEHHARFDGTGYPALHAAHHHGHHAEDEHGTLPSPGSMHLYSRLVAVVDTYDAITTRRSYRRAETPSRALYALMQGLGTAYDPDAVRAFITLMGVYPPGSLLLLRDGGVAMVVDSEPAERGLPRAFLVASEPGRPLAVPEPITLARESVVDQIPADLAGVDTFDLLDEVQGGTAAEHGAAV